VIVPLLAALALGLANQPGDAAHARALHVGYRYQYLAGGVGTGDGWSTWNPDGTFVTNYVRESRRHRLVPVLTYYMLLQSAPAQGDEAQRDLANLRDPELMARWYDDLALALRRAHQGSGGKRVVLHVEPDLWGYVQQAAAGDDAATVPAAVAASGDARLAGLPDTAAGVARAVVRLRDRLAPEVALGWHMSTWGTKVDPVLSDPPLPQVERLARRSAKFYKSLDARFDAIFTDPSDRDDGFKTFIYGDGGAGRWTRADYRRDLRWLRTLHRATRLPLVQWQIPLGNSRLPNTWGAYRDTHVETLLGSRRMLRAYRDAGVAGLLFGGGADGTTDERHDRGLFRRLAARYARHRLRVR
jgi:hypothetical protein